MKDWYVYMVRCADDSLYTGITTDVQRRIKEHNSKTPSAAKYTRTRQPVELVYIEQHDSRGSATSREMEIKKLAKKEKLKLLGTINSLN